MAWACGLPAGAIELDLTGVPLELELWNLELTVAREEGADTGSLGIRHRDPERGPVDPSLFASELREGKQLVSRRDVQDEHGPRLVGSLRLGRSQAVVLVGHAIDLTWSEPEGEVLEDDSEGSPEERPEASPEVPQPPETAKIEIALEGSRASFHRLGSASIFAQNSRLELTEARGQSVVSADDASVTLEALQGSLTFEGRRSDLLANGSRGALQFRLSGGSASLNQGVGTVEGQGDGALVSMASWRGAVTLGGTSATLDVLGLKGAQSVLTVTGRELDGRIRGVEGDLVARVEGGRLVAEGVRGTVQLTAQGRAEVDLADVTGQVDLHLEEGSRAAVDRSQHVLAEARGAELEVGDSLDLRANLRASSSLRLSGVVEKPQITLLDSIAESAGGVLTGLATLALQGASWAEVELRAPCLVQVAQQRAIDASRVTVTGCELLTGRVRGGRGRYSAAPATKLLATLEEDGQLRVDGSP